jgi:high-affinity iron transporter
MRKWVYAAGDRTITFFTVRRPDGEIVAALDLCEICQPKGYAQMGSKHVFCKYCKTPIPLETVGQAGGCNPVPLPSSVDHGVLRVPRAELLAIHARAMADKR